MQERIIFIILLVGGIWLILDDFFGKKYLSTLAVRLTSTFKTPVESVKQEAKDFVRPHTQNEYKDIGIPKYDDIFRKSLPVQS